jgi:hypothetical protein
MEFQPFGALGLAAQSEPDLHRAGLETLQSSGRVPGAPEPGVVRAVFDNGRASYLERDLLRNATVLAKEIDTPPCVHDVAGGLYLLRTLNLEPGHSTQIAVSDGKKSVMAKVEAQQREEIKTPAGTFKAIRYEVYLFNNVLYNRSAHLYVWLTDDRRKLPVQIRVRMQVTIGTITLQLEKQE